MLKSKIVSIEVTDSDELINERITEEEAQGWSLKNIIASANWLFLHFVIGSE